jgi:hypothetical protein
MDERAGRTRAAVGVVVKSGWAVVVLVTGSPPLPRVADSRRIDLSDPAVPEGRQPYHAGFGTERGSGPELRRLVDAVQRFGRKSVTAVLRTYKIDGHELAGVGVVVGSVIAPERIANRHIRIHALEGQLFRSVVQEAVRGRTLPCLIWRERDLYASAAAALGRPEPHVRDRVVQLGRGVAGAWRTEHKAAAVAAWLVLATSERVTRPMRRAGERPNTALHPTPPASLARRSRRG